MRTAYDVLSDDDKRRKYDQFGIEGLKEGGGGGGFGGGFGSPFDFFNFGFGGGGHNHGACISEDAVTLNDARRAARDGEGRDDSHPARSHA